MTGCRLFLSHPYQRKLHNYISFFPKTTEVDTVLLNSSTHWRHCAVLPKMCGCVHGITTICFERQFCGINVGRCRIMMLPQYFEVDAWRLRRRMRTTCIKLYSRPILRLSIKFRYYLTHELLERMLLYRQSGNKTFSCFTVPYRLSPRERGKCRKKVMISCTFTRIGTMYNPKYQPWALSWPVWIVH
jgi:hypothetical protein